MRRDRGWIMAEDAGRGYRRVVASPAPQSIVEWPAVKALIDSDVLVIAAGGGGVPVICDEAGRLHGVEAVIDKDLCVATWIARSGTDAGPADRRRGGDARLWDA
jgi:carbamate kinase